MDVTYEMLRGFELPLVVRPVSTRVTREDFLAWVQQAQPAIEDRLLAHGALLFRGFPLVDAADMEAVVQAFGGEALDYLGGATSRRRVRGKVFTSTEISRFYQIRLHNELSYQPLYPDRVFFFCRTPAAVGGETILADMRRVCADLDPRLVERFRERQVQYVRVFQERRRLREALKKAVIVYFHLTWQDVFETTSRAVVEAQCARLGMRHRWRRNGDLEVTNVLPAVRRHPLTGEEVWFNHLNILYPSVRTLGRVIYWTQRLLYRRPGGRPYQVAYGDGTSIPFEDVRPVLDAIERRTVTFPWQRGDLLLVDNRSVAHGRNPFRGPRSVLVSMVREAPRLPGTADVPALAVANQAAP